MAFSGVGGSIYIASGTSVTFTDEAMTNQGDNKTYVITNSNKRFWDTSQTVTVKKNGSVISSGFTVQYPGGKVIFDVANAPTDTITVSGKYIPVSLLGEANEWSLDMGADTIEVNIFGTAVKQYIPTMTGASGSLKHYWIDGSFLSALRLLLGFELRVNDTYKYQMYGY
ncbi:MAG: hypothetical protein H5U39_07340, partial [Deferribacterales bacterium]|nr:hypothetical protein [Deferribacterales bacterium]